MIKEYTKEEMIDLIIEYSSINLDKPIEFYVDDNSYVLEYKLPHDYLTNRHMEYDCIAKLFEEYNQKHEEMETILTIKAHGLIFDDIEDGWEDRHVISSFTMEWE